MAGLDERGLHWPPLFHWAQWGDQEEVTPGRWSGGAGVCPRWLCARWKLRCGRVILFLFIIFRLRSCVPHTQRSPGEQGQQGQASSHLAPSCAGCVVGFR